MKRVWVIILVGLTLGASAFGFLYASRTADYRALEEHCGPELAWIKKEFQLNDAEFERVRELHQAYKPVCAEMCQRIDEQNQELARLLQSSHDVTPQIEAVLAKAARLRTECQTQMLRHFFQVSRAMPPGQGQRYLAWMQEQTLTPTHQSMLPKVGAKPGHDTHAGH
jgi:hypothetical protein